MILLLLLHYDSSFQCRVQLQVGELSQEVLSENICDLSIATQAQWWGEVQHAVNPQSKAPFELLLWPVLPATCVNVSWKSELLHWESPGRWSGSSHNWIMWPWLFCFSPNPHLWWIPTWLAPNLALQAASDPAPCLWGVALVTPQTLKPLCDFKPLSREKNKGSCSNQAPNQEQLLHSDYRYLSGTQETLSEWASTE